MHKVIALTTAVLCLSMIVLSDEMTAEEAAVWQLEEAYYQYAKANDPEAYLALFDEDVIGWPSSDKAPKGKANVSQWISAVHENPLEIWNYELELLAIQSFGDVVVAHYLLRDFFVDSASGEEISSATNRISHTWQRSGNTWKIISGMGGPQN